MSGTKQRRRDELFLSHATQDRRFVNRLHAMLRKEGFRVWYSRTHLVTAEQWHDEIGRALRRCTWFVVVLSENAVRSMWLKRELVYALGRRRLRERIVPVLYKSCDIERLSWALPAYQMADSTQSFQDGQRQLLRIWSSGKSFR